MIGIWNRSIVYLKWIHWSKSCIITEQDVRFLFLGSFLQVHLVGFNEEPANLHSRHKNLGGPFQWAFRAQSCPIFIAFSSPPRAQWHHPVGGDDCITIGTARWMAFLGLNISNIGLKTVTDFDIFLQIPKSNIADMVDIAHEK